MPARTDFERHLEREPLLSIYALTGAEPSLLHAAIATLRQRVLTRAADFNRDEFRAGEDTADRVRQAAATLPMMAEHRWVHLRDAHKLKGKDTESLAAYVERPAPQTVLCLSADKLDLRTKLAQRLLAHGALFLFDPPRQKELPTWITARAKVRGYAITAEAAQLLADLIGVDLGAVDTALDKLALFAGASAVVEVEHVEACVAPTRVHSIFNLTDAIGRRELGNASLILRNSLQGGESALMILAMIARHLRQLLQLRALRARGVPTIQAAQQLGVRAFLAETLANQARRFSELELALALESLAQADLRLKSTNLDAGVVLDRLLVDLLGTPETPS